MRLLLTGGSSFTGFWFARALREQGHEVMATARSPAAGYQGLRAERVGMLSDLGVQWIHGCSFGDENFLALLGSARIDVVCHHGAQVGDYRSPDFDVGQALQANTLNARLVFEAMHRHGVRALVATGSVFESQEGAGSEPGRAFSPYGLSKGLSWQVLQHWSMVTGVALYKFIVANPFGPWEEPRFCAYLLRTWAAGEVATVVTPDYVRDNIHVSLLARCYADYVLRCIEGQAPTRLGPVGYAESQGAFARRFAEQISQRLDIPAPLKLGVQADFGEPFVRINTARVDAQQLGWDEAAAWDALADYYRTTYLRGRH